MKNTRNRPTRSLQEERNQIEDQLTPRVLAARARQAANAFTHEIERLMGLIEDLPDSPKKEEALMKYREALTELGKVPDA